MDYSEIEAYYDTMWNRYKGVTVEEMVRLYFIISEIKKIIKFKDISIIDLGCGRGWLTNALTKYGNVVGVDLSIKIAKRLYPNLKFVKANIVTDNIDGIYDVIVSSEVIEHLFSEDQNILIKKCYNMLNTDGYLILTAPNTEAVSIDESKNEEFQPLENWISKKRLVSIMKPYFKVKFIGSTLFYPKFIRDRRWLCRPYNVFLRLFGYRLLNKFLKSTFYGMFLVVVAKKDMFP
jgi:2-polyprenyl-3-methyl-5-hydroxy-6-metoxy-1,4-benzoquinol methylase